MTLYTKRIILSVAMFFLFFNDAAKAQENAKIIRVSAPFLSTLFQRNEDTKEASILNGIGALCQMKFDYSLAPFGRHVEIFLSDDRLDAVSSVLLPAQVKGFWTKPYIGYQNGFIYLEKEGFNPRHYDDLRDKRVIAFVGAEAYLPGLKDNIKKFDQYSEVANQYSHVQLLFADRIDVVIAEKYITLMNAMKLSSDVERHNQRMSTLRFLPFYETNPGHMVFKDQGLQQRFDACLDKPEAKAFIKETEDMFNQDYPNYVVPHALSNGGKP